MQPSWEHRGAENGKPPVAVTDSVNLGPTAETRSLKHCSGELADSPCHNRQIKVSSQQQNNWILLQLCFNWERENEYMCVFGGLIRYTLKEKMAAWQFLQTACFRLHSRGRRGAVPFKGAWVLFFIFPFFGLHHVPVVLPVSVCLDE